MTFDGMEVMNEEKVAELLLLRERGEGGGKLSRFLSCEATMLT